MEKKKNKKDVSIIVPVYNVENYLKDCLDSLVNQDYDNNKYELILINDCSKDSSLNILKEYVKKYNNITIIDFKENRGVSRARNEGIKKSCGEYLLFCDADDFYEKNAISIFMETAKKDNADFVMGNYYILKGNKKIPVYSTNYYKNNNITKKEIISYMTLTSCSKLIKKSLFTDNNIFYPEDLKKCEELSVIPIVAYKAKNPIKIDNCLYYYVQRKESASNEKYKNVKESDLSFFDESFNRFISFINRDEYKEEIEFRAIDHLLYGKCLVMLKSKIKKELIKNYVNKFTSKYPLFMSNKYLDMYSKPKRIYIYCLKNKLFFQLKIMTFAHKMVTE